MKKHTPTRSMQSAAKRGVEMTKKPELSGNDIPEVSMKGGKKIASGQAISDDHVRSMAAYHSAHLGDCPAGGDAEHADDLLWGGPAGASWSASRVAAMDATSLADSPTQDVDEMLKSDCSLEIFTREDLIGRSDFKKDENGLIWAPIIRSGTLAVRPGPNGTRVHEPLVFVSGHATNATEIGLEDLLGAFKEEAVEHVTIPRTHANDTFENTGRIVDMKIVDSTLRPGETVILAGHKFTEPDVEGAVERGSVLSRSCGILHNYVNTETGKSYPHVIEHVALTNKAWVPGMEPYGSDLFSQDREIVGLMLSDNQIVPPPKPDRLPPPIFSTATPREQLERELKLADIVWGEQDGEPSLSQIQSQLYEALRSLGKSPYYDEDSLYFYVRDVRPSSALVELDYGGSDPGDAWVIPFSMADGKLALADFSQWQVVEQAWVADDDANQDKDEVQAILTANTDLSVHDRADAITYLAVSQAERDKAKKDSNSLPDGSYPINNAKQLKAAAVLAASKHGNWQAAKSLIRRRAKELGVDLSTLPGFGDSSKSSKSPKGKSNMGLPTDPLKRASALRLSQEQPNQQPGGNMPLDAETLARLDLSDEVREVLQREITAGQRDATELARLRAEKRQSGTKDRLTKLSEAFGEGATGLLNVFSNLLLADDGDVAVTLLADGGQKTNLTITDAIDQIIAALPTDDKGKIALAQKTNLLENPLDRRPDLKPDPSELDGVKEMSGDELFAQWQKDLPGLDLAIPAVPAAK